MSRELRGCCAVLLLAAVWSCEQPRNTKIPEQIQPSGQGAAPVTTERGGSVPVDAAMNPVQMGTADSGQAEPTGGGMECPDGEHACGGTCVSNDDVMTCGTLCSPCPAPEGGVAECRSGTCFSKCPEGQRDCQARCIEESAPCGGCPVGQNPCSGVCTEATNLQACGSACKPCPTDPDGNGMATCDGTSCELVCNTGYHRCGDRCASDSDPATCGSRCDPCPDSGGRATCVDGLCDFECPGGRKCNGGCVPMNAACGEMCADGYTFCTGRCIPNAEVPKEVCDGKDNDCDGEVDEGDLTRQCRSACGTGTERCDGRGGWVGCTAPQASAEVCDGRDNDCDGQVDENLTRQCRSACGTGTERCDGRGGWTGCTAGQPATENCGNGRDDDCDGRTDCADSDCRAGTSCGSNRVCMGGQCAACTEGQSCSPGGNANPCKNYGRRCSDGSGACVETGNRTGSCGGSGICQNGQCLTCTGGQKLCGTRCQVCCDSETRACQNNCQEGGTERCSGGQWGSCSAPRKQCCGNGDCTNGFRCENNGTCSTSTCANGSQRVCGGRCVSCPSVANGQVGCSGTNCVLQGCANGFFRCGETCVQNGTRCGNSCGTGFKICSSGCVGTNQCCEQICGSAGCDGSDCRVDVSGSWQGRFSDGREGGVATISQNRASLTISNFDAAGGVASGSISRNIITVRFNGTTFSGTVASDRRRINWNNNTFWVKI